MKDELQRVSKHHVIGDVRTMVHALAEKKTRIFEAGGQTDRETERQSQTDR